MWIPEITSMISIRTFCSSSIEFRSVIVSQIHWREGYKNATNVSFVRILRVALDHMSMVLSMMPVVLSMVCMVFSIVFVMLSRMPLVCMMGSMMLTRRLLHL